MKRAKHSLSKFSLLTCNQGELVPLGKPLEVYPGDTMQQASSLFIRLSPLVTPVMHPVHVRVHHWFVPHRLVWEDFEDFITGGPDGADASVFPTITPNTGSGYAAGSLADYLAVPTGVDDKAHSALPFRGYQMIWNEFYRDPDLHTAAVVDLTSGADTTTEVDLKNVCWEKDYFTVARVDPQKGPDITLPLGTEAPVLGIGKINQTFGSGAKTVYESDDTTSDYAATALIDVANENQKFYVEEGTTGYPNIHADLTNATAATLNELREAIALQRFEEARARFGSRYVEYLRYLGIRSADGRLARPEYLGGGKAVVQFSEALQTSVTTSGTPVTGVGNMAGHGVGAVRSNRYRRFFDEHGYVFSLLSVMPKTMYCTGLPRDYSYTTKEDFWHKELEAMGPQEILNKELYWAHSDPNGVHGYIDRYDHLRRAESSVHGDFRGSLNTWHMGRIFAGDTALNDTFVEANPTNRIYQSTTYDQLYVMAMHSVQARRLIARRGDPGRLAL